MLSSCWVPVEWVSVRRSCKSCRISSSIMLLGTGRFVSEVSVDCECTSVGSLLYKVFNRRFREKQLRSLTTSNNSMCCSMQKFKPRLNTSTLSVLSGYEDKLMTFRLLTFERGQNELIHSSRIFGNSSRIAYTGSLAPHGPQRERTSSGRSTQISI